MATTAPVVSDSKAPPAPAVAAPKAKSGPSRRLLIAIGVVLVVAVIAVAYWIHASHFEETDDAQIDGTISNISPRVSGTVNAVYIVENQVVKAGDVLAELDPADLALSVELAKAQVAQAEAQVQVEDPNVSITQATNVTALASAQSDLAGSQAALSAARKEVDQLVAQIVQAEANDRTAQLEKDRSSRLLAQGAVSQAEFDQRTNAAAASTANIDALKQSLAAARDRVTQQDSTLRALRSHVAEVTSNSPLQVETKKASVQQRRAALDLARAQLAQAELNLSYAKIIAPADGIVAKKSIAVGDYVAPGQQVVALTQTRDMHVTANFRETQLQRMHPGLTVKLHVDALGEDLTGRVEMIGGATGSSLSVFPPENATGNYVKVVQRIPVRVSIDPGQPGFDRLRIGMSVEPRVSLQ